MNSSAMRSPTTATRDRPKAPTSRVRRVRNAWPPGLTRPPLPSAGSADRPRPRTPGLRRCVSYSDDRSDSPERSRAGTGPDGSAPDETQQARSTARRWGPKMAVTGTPSAAARCITPESLEMNVRHIATRPISWERSVRPIRLTTPGPAPTRSATDASEDSIAQPASRSCALPTSATAAPSSRVRRSITPA